MTVFFKYNLHLNILNEHEFFKRCLVHQYTKEQNKPNCNSEFHIIFKIFF